MSLIWEKKLKLICFLNEAKEEQGWWFILPHAGSNVNDNTFKSINSNNIKEFFLHLVVFLDFLM